MALNDDNLKRAFEHILEAITELKTSNSGDITSISKQLYAVKALLDRQDLGKMPAGAIVNKKHCETMAIKIEGMISKFIIKIEEDQTKFTKDINTKLVWAYSVMAFGFTGIGGIIYFIASQVF